MNNNVIKLLAEEASQDNKIFILVAVLVFLLFAVLLFIYLASCIIIVKQGTRKIVERFGSYNRTLKEGIHIIFRPFDRIVPVPWNVLSISERDEYRRNLASGKVRFRNDKRRKDAPQASVYEDAKRLEEVRASIRGDVMKDIRILMREKYIDQSENVSEALADTLNIEAAVRRSSGQSMSEIVDGIVTSEQSLVQLEKSYRAMGIDFYRADKKLLNEVREADALAASVRYYPRHQDPRSKHPGLWAMAENHVMDYIDLREQHIDTSSDKVRQDEKFGELKFITKDNASVGANVVIFFSVTDPFLYYYGVSEPQESLVLLAITTLRNIVSTLTLEEVLQARSEINKKIRAELDIATNNWGIKANRVELKEFILDPEMRIKMNDVLVAEREKRAEILRAEGKAEALKKIKDAKATADVLRLEGYKTLQEVSKGSANKVFIPNDLSDFITGAHVVADAFKDAKKEEEK